MSPYVSLALGGAPQRSGEWRPDQPDRRRRTRRLGGSYEVGRNGTKIELTIDADSIDTGNPKRDEHLRSSDFFDVGDHAQVHFRNMTFRTTSAIGFVVGFALFGSVTFIPLYLQIVKGHSATDSGLLMTR